MSSELKVGPEHHTTDRASPVRTASLLVGASVLAVAINQAIAVIARGAAGEAGFAPLTLPVFGAFTVVGVIGGWVGWWAVSHQARRPRSILAVLVPLVALASFLPDVVLLVTPFIPGTTTAGVLGLMAMHVTVVVVAVPTYVLATPPGRASA